MTLLSVCIPVYSMQNRGIEFLAYNLKQLKAQKFKDFEIVISDNSEDDVIQKYIEGVKDLNIKYVKNEGDKTLPSNFNNVIANASSEIVHIMCQDDFFYNQYSLQRIVDNFNKDKGWMVSMYMHSKDRLGLFKQQIPEWNDKIYFNNTIGAPSCLTMLKNDLLFDKNLTWFVDCEFYWQLYKKYGLPKILKEIIFVQLLWDGQVTNTGVTQELINTEIAYIKDKYLGEIV